MKKLFALVTVVSTVAFAQEIGTEISPVTPEPSPTVRQPEYTQPADNPYAQPQQPQPAAQPQRSSGYQYRPAGKRPSEPSYEGPKQSAGEGDFGIRGGFGPSGSTSVAAGATVSLGAPFVGISYWATDQATLNIDLGFGIGLGGRGAVPVALGAKLGLDYHGRNPGASLRPLFALGASFNMTLVGSSAAVAISAEIGGGAAYFFSPSFSLTGKLLLSVPMTVSPGFSIAFFSLSPGMTASWYF